METAKMSHVENCINAIVLYTRMRLVHVKALLCLMVLWLPAQLTAQSIHFDQLSIAEGLSSNSVYSIFQDSHGIIWFGTLDGLNRYDGYGITVFKHDNQRKQSLSNNRITNIYEDRNQQLWLFDEFTSTIIRYNTGKEEFTPYYLDKIVGNDLRMLDTLYETPDGTFYVRSIDGYKLRHNKHDDSFEYIQKESPIDWSQKKEWEPLLQAFTLTLKQSGSSFNARSIVIRKIIKDSEGRYWIATKFDGLYSATEDHGNFEFISHLHTSEKYMYVNSEEIYDMYEDRSNVIWIGTKNNGLYRHSRYKYKFDHLEEVMLPNGSFHLGTIRSIAEDADQNIWLGTNEQGLVRVDRTHKKNKLYKADPSNPHRVGHRFIRSLWIDDNRNLWVGHYNGFSRYRPSTDDFVSYYPKTNPEEVRVYDFKKGKGNSIWMAGWDLIIRFDPTTTTYEFISRSASREQGFADENIRELELDADGDLWIAAGEKGMSLYDKVKNQFTTVYYTSSSSNGLPSRNLFDVFKDSHNNLWVATADGLCRFDPVNLTCETFSVNEGLPSNLVYGILEDKQGNLWLSTTKGIAKFDPHHKTFRNYDVNDGLQSNEFTENAYFQNPEGIMFFGGINGINIFDPENIPDNPTPPQLAIISLKIYEKPLAETTLFNETMIRKKIATHEPIMLAPEQRSISIDFVALHYVNPQKNKFAYRLEGFDETWTYRDANVRFASYTNLEPGDYTFVVKASNSDGIWSQPIQLRIIVDQPFYATGWFISSLTVLVLMVGVVSYRWRIKALKKQQSMKSIQLESELNFLKSQVNPHFLFNTLNNIYALCQINSRNAAPMVGKISDMMRYMIYDCNGDLVLLKKEIEYLQNYIDLNQLKSSRKLNAFITIEGNPEGFKIAPLLLINFLENSFKHGDLNSNGDGFIQVMLTLEGTQLMMLIRNSFREKPIPDSAQKGIGLDNVKHRLALLYPGKHTLRIEKNNTIFEIQLNIQLN